MSGRPANNLDTSADSVRLRVVAFDNGSGIKDLKINGLSITADSTGLIWYCDINALTHSLRGNKITVVAVVMVLPTVGGLYLDKIAGMENFHIFTVLGSVGGFAGGLYYLLKMVKNEHW